MDSWFNQAANTGSIFVDYSCQSSLDFWDDEFENCKIPEKHKKLEKDEQETLKESTHAEFYKPKLTMLEDR